MLCKYYIIIIIIIKLDTDWINKLKTLLLCGLNTIIQLHGYPSSTVSKYSSVWP